MENPKKEISFKKFLYEALSEVWSYEMWSFVIILVLVSIIKPIINGLIFTRDDALTTSNFSYILFSPQGILIIIFIVIIGLVYVCVELFAEIVLIGKVIGKEKESSFFFLILESLKRAIESIKAFLNPLGFLWIIYLVVISPVVGFTFTISATKNFYVPNFIMDFINKKLLYVVPYTIISIAFSIFGFIYIFTFHGVLLKGETLREAMKNSRQMVTNNWKNLLFKLVRLGAVILLIYLLCIMFLQEIPLSYLKHISKTLPQNYDLNYFEKMKLGIELSDLDVKVLLMRFAVALTSIEGVYIIQIIKLLCDACVMIFITKYYVEYSNSQEITFTDIPKRKKYAFKIVICILGAIFFRSPCLVRKCDN